MSQFEKALDKLLRGRSDQSFDFKDLRQILLQLGFDERVRGSHHIFTHDKVVEILNLQPKGSKAKAYQVKQVREILLRYRLVPKND
jgi:predicted RNA binding protein YcfA (HicA-like mRNA interferase family)